MDDTRQSGHNQHVVKFEDLFGDITFLGLLIESPTDDLTRIVDTGNLIGRLVHSRHGALGETLLLNGLVELVVRSVVGDKLIGLGIDVLIGLRACRDLMRQISQTGFLLRLGLARNLNNVVTKRSFHHAHRTHRIVDHILVELRNHLSVSEPIEVTAFVLRGIGVVLSSQLGKQLVVVLGGSQLSQQFVGLGFGLFLGSDGILAAISAFVTNQDMAGLQ